MKNKYLLLLIISILLVINSIIVLGADQVQENNTGGSYGGNSAFAYSNYYQTTGFGWNATASYNLSQVELWLRNETAGAIRGEIRAHIFTLSANLTPNAWVATSSTFITNTSLINSLRPINFSFSPAVSITNGSLYGVLVNSSILGAADANYGRLDSASSGTMKTFTQCGTIAFPCGNGYWVILISSSTGHYIFYGNTTVTPEEPEQNLINITALSPLNDSQTSLQTISINATVNSANTFNATLFINGTINQTRTGISSGTGVNVSFNITFSSTGQPYSFQFNMSINATDYELSNLTTIFIDPTNPDIVTNFTNLTIVNLFSNLTATFNLSDDFNLWSYNITLDGTTRIANATGLNVTSIQVNITYNISFLEVGHHNITIRIADGHTAKKLKTPYVVKNGIFNNYLKFEFPEGQYALIEGDSFSDKFYSEQKEDRYKFQYLPANRGKDIYSFYVESDDDVNIISNANTEWKKWLIVGEDWIDFLPEDFIVKDITISRVNKNRVKVDVQSKTIFSDNITFQSVGDLNIIEVNYTFISTNATVTYPEPVNELQSITITLNINLTQNITNTNATLYYNNTRYIPTKTNYTLFQHYENTFLTPALTASRNISFWWNYSLFGVSGNQTGILNNTHQVFRIGVDNCSTYSIQALNFTLFNETSNQVLESNGTLDGFFKLWVSDAGNFTSFNSTWRNDRRYSLCIDPPNANLSVYAQFEYDDLTVGADGMALKNYFITNTTLTNQSSNITLYLTMGTTQTAFTVRDEDDEGIEGAIIKILSYDLGTDSAVTTEIVKTDTDGTAQAQIVRSTQFYQFIVEVDGVVKLSTQPTKITAATNIFRISLQSDYYSNFDISQNIATSLTFNNLTNTFSYVFSNPDGTSREACLFIVRRLGSGDTTVNQSCITSSAGTINLRIQRENATFVATGIVRINPSFLERVLSVDLSQRHLVFGLSGVLLSLFMGIFFVTVGLFSPVIAIVLFLVSLLASQFLNILHFNYTIFIGLIVGFIIVIIRAGRN